jgi:hypothetical protein
MRVLLGGEAGERTTRGYERISPMKRLTGFYERSRMILQSSGRIAYPFTAALMTRLRIESPWLTRRRQEREG